jgi:branched-chain amino acid transport system substrate-binding protein
MSGRPFETAARRNAPLVFFLLGIAAGCAGPRPPGPLPPEAVPPERTQSGSVAEDLSRLGEEPERDREETERLRRELAQSEDPAQAARLRMRLAERFEAEGRTGEAVVLYCTVSGDASDAGLGARAWDGVARIRNAEGDASGAARARLEAWELAAPAERSGRTADLRRALEELTTPEVQALSRETFSLAAHEHVAAELASRGASGRSPSVDFPIVVLAPFTGRFEKFGSTFLLGARIALEDREARELHAGGGRAGRLPVRLSTRDTGGDLLTASNGARQAIVEDRARVILGPLLSVTSIGAGAVAQSYGVPLVAPTATDPGVREIGRFVLALEPPSQALAERLAEFSVNVLRNVRHGVLVPEEPAAEDLERRFRKAVEERGAEVVVTVSYAPDQADFRRLLERIEEADVDAVYMPGAAAELEKLAPQLEFYEFRRRILGHGGWLSPRVLDAENLAMEGGIFAVTSADHPDSEFTRHLREEVWSRSGEEMTRFHVEGYRSMWAVLAALDLGARSAEEIVEVLRHREYWLEPPPGDQIDVVTFRDGAIGPADWAVGFDLTPTDRPRDRKEDAGDADSAAALD